MILDLRDIPADGLDVERSIDLPEPKGDDGERLVVGSATLAGRAAPGVRGVDLAARLTAGLRLVCSRCLEPFPHRLRVDFELTIVAEAIEAGPEEVELATEDTTLFHAEAGRADLRAIATEQVYLNLPLKPVCRADCAGLCPTCGANRNRIECACSRAEVDPRLAPLLDWKKRVEGP